MSYDHWKTTEPDNESEGESCERIDEEEYWRMREEEKQHAKTIANEIQYEAEIRKLSNK